MAPSFHLSQLHSLVQWVQGRRQSALIIPTLLSVLCHEWRQVTPFALCLDANFKREQNWLPSLGRLETPFLLGSTCSEGLAKSRKHHYLGMYHKPGYGKTSV